MGNFNPTLPTKYRGTDKYITYFVSRNREPTGADYRQPETGTLYSVGTVWQVGKDPTTGTEGELWMLSKIVANIAYWIRIDEFDDATTYVADSGSATAAGGILNVVGTAAQGLSTSGTGNTLTFTVADATTTQKGVSRLATNSEAIAGSLTTNVVINPGSLAAKLGAQTLNGLAYGGGPTAALNWLGNATNGQLPIGSTGAAPVLGNLTSTGGTITITNGPGTINLESDATAGNIRFSARKSADSANATGDGTNVDVICDTVLFNVGSGYNGGTGVFTAPVTGDYFFMCIIATALTTSTPSAGLVNFCGHAYDSNPTTMSTGTSTGLSLVYSQFLHLTAGAPVSISMNYSGSTKAVTIQGGAGVSGCFFNGFLVG